MPLYDYCCSACGAFRDWQAMARATEPVHCPTCASPAERVVAAPFIATMKADTRIAHERNEKSAHEPQVMSRKQLNGIGRRRAEVAHAHHGHGHGHDHGLRKIKGLEPVHDHGRGSHRPWMIGH